MKYSEASLQRYKKSGPDLQLMFVPVFSFSPIILLGHDINIWLKPPFTGYFDFSLIVMP